MKAGIHFLGVNLIALLSLLNYQATTCNAGELTYSWTGHLRLYDDTSPDPWMIGDDDAEFQIETTVSTNAVDQNDSQVPFAAFSAISSRLWVDGLETTYMGDAYIDFADLEDIADLISASGSFSRFGHTLEIATTVALDFTTFSFVADSESPPQFNPMFSNSRASSGPRPYVTIVFAGTQVSVVPEPNTLLIVSCGLLALASQRHR